MMRPKILMIDDEKDFLDDLSLLLNRRYEIIKAVSSKRGWGLFNSSTPDIVLLDLDMPAYYSNSTTMEGYALLKKIRAKSSIPVIIISDQDPPKGDELYTRQGVSSFIPKPCEVKNLIKQIDEVLTGLNQQ